MAVTDPIADYLTRIRNAQQAKHRVVSIPSSKLKRKITEILYEQGYILKYTFQGEGKDAVINIAIKYNAETKQPVIRELGRLSTPGLRQFASHRTWHCHHLHLSWFDDGQGSPQTKPGRGVPLLRILN
jgi:ribosomal protein S8